jgi:hypothetical protein
MIAPLLARLHDDATARDKAGNRRLFFDQYAALLLGTFSEGVYRVVDKRGQLARRLSAPIGAGRQAAPTSCASADGSAPSAELSTSAPCS